MRPLNDLQKAEIEILRSFIEICKKNNLKYYAVGGTCLGAIRHSGFIPWDDDIDVALPREHYERFMEIAQTSLPDYYFLQTFKTDVEYPSCFAKIRDSRTTFIESSVKNLSINHGVYIDVFPLDFYPEKGKRVFKFEMLLYKARFSTALSSVPSFKIRLLRLISNIMHPDIKEAQQKLNDLLKNMPVSSSYINVFGSWGNREIAPISWFENGKQVKFEDIYLTVPKDYDKYLERLYGDYMTPPPAEQQISHHFNEIVDPDKPYTQYV